MRDLNTDPDVEEEKVHAEVYRDGFVHVMADKCSSCIFRSVNDGRIMGLAPGRVGSMVVEARANESVIPCHQTLYEADVKPAVCRGYFDTSSEFVRALRMAQALGIIKYQQPKDEE